MLPAWKQHQSFRSSHRCTLTGLADVHWSDYFTMVAIWQAKCPSDMVALVSDVCHRLHRLLGLSLSCGLTWPSGNDITQLCIYGRLSDWPEQWSITHGHSSLTVSLPYRTQIGLSASKQREWNKSFDKAAVMSTPHSGSDRLHALPILYFSRRVVEEAVSSQTWWLPSVSMRYNAWSFVLTYCQLFKTSCGKRLKMCQALVRWGRM